ncbi:NB-ARC domain-containing protein [Streptomyces sp. yr375]|uniref:NB-ARC domain-containing protein n=1 Tax=Streptomyces sp. yr375 TaxID=1761906 RepID=UPI0008B06D3D|nr:NB-ARC domain-containing protein [Streptomyces sp. yr375]SES48712.1 NB-ARC domain-containing protein [Streptomyces sp. yr375]
MEAELAALAASGATTLVGLMVSESWERAKSGLAPFFGRRASGAAAEEELQAASQELDSARAAGDVETQAEVRARLRQRLEGMFEADPRAAAELAQLLSELAPDASRTFVNLVGGGVNHGPAFQGSHIHGGITFNVQQTPARGPGRTLRPDQVPAVTVPFSNRTAELAVLDKALGAPGARAGGSGSVDVGVLDGLPGVGKSTMAWQWAATARGLFPDGQLYVDFAALRDRSAPVTAAGADVSEALAMCLRSLSGSDDGIPSSLAERTNLFRSRSADLRILLVLDDVNQPAQVRALIPKGPGSAVLVTSQGRLGELALDGARLISVEPLDAHGGLTLLKDRCGAEAVDAEPEAARRLVELCGGLPVALQIVAARLVTDDILSMTALAAELDDEAGRLAGMTLEGEEFSVSAVLGTSYRLLPPDAARLYRLLGWLPVGVFDAGVAAVAADTDPRSAKRLLGVLAKASLVEAMRDGRYRMHDLVRLHARERAAQEEPDTEQRALTERVGTHYLVLTAFADRALRQDRLRIADLSALLRDADDPFAGADGPPPLEWLDTERPAILAILRTAVRQGLATLAWRLAEAFTVLFLYRRHLGAWKESLELGAEAASAAAASAATAGEIEEATAAEARLRSLLSRPLLDLGENDRAGAELATAVALSEASGHLVLRASVREFLGRYRDLFEPSRAVEAYQLSLELNERAGEARGAAIAAYFLGCAQDARGDHAQALVTLDRARRDLETSAEPDRRMAARASAAIGVVRGHLGETDEAMRELREAARVLREEAATHYEAQALVQLADIAERTGDGEHLDLVRECLSRAVEIHEAAGSGLAESLRRRLADLG